LLSKICWADQLLAFPLRLSAPWWWITSLTVIAVAIVLLALIDHAKQHHTSE
jgi:ABC-type microcin C transport system permease subunit YejE